MLQRIREVIAVANSATSDINTKKQALEYLNEVKSNQNSAQIFASLLTDAQSDDLTKFVSLQVLSDIASQYNTGDITTQAFIKNAILDSLRDKISNNVRDPEYVRNKIAELITRLFYSMYGEVNSNQWSDFFDDIITILSIEQLTKSPSTLNEFSLLGIDYFNRICGFINSEIADQTFVRSKDIQMRNNNLKDTMRISATNILVTIWLNTLKSLIPHQENQFCNEVSILTLSCIGSFISWIDVNLIITEDYISVVYNYLDFPQTKMACAQCLCEIISKKMKPIDKLTLLGMLNLTDKVASIDHDNIEVQEQLAKLASSVGLELSIILEQCNEQNGDSSIEVQQVANAADQQIIGQVAPLVLRFMSHEYDSVTQQCFPFITQYLSILKKLFALGGKPGSAVALNSKRQPLDNLHSEFLTSLLNVCFKKMRVDESCDDSSDSQDDIDEFNDTIRSKLKTFQDSIAVINPQLYLENLSNQIQTLLSTSTDWRDLELAIYQMHGLCESIRNNLFGLNKTEIAHSQPTMVANKFMNTLLSNTSILDMDNSLIQISFFELIVRHYKFLQNNEKNEFAILNIFCSQAGIFNKKEKARLRTWYLFTRFIKTLKPKFTIPILKQIISKIAPLLVVKVGAINPNGSEIDTTFDNQMYIFEGVGYLIGANSDSNYDILEDILNPLFTDLEQCISSQVQTPEVVLQCHHILMSIGTLARGIHGGLVPENQVNNALVSEKLIQPSLIKKFSNIAEVVLVTFSYFNKFESIRDASRFTFSRLIPILNNSIVPFANKLIALFLESDLSMLEMNDFLGFLGQMVHTFHKDEGCYQLFNTLITPVINKVHSVLDMIDQEEMASHANGITNKDHQATNRNIIVTDTFRDKVLLKKAYFAFLQAFVTNSVTSLLLNESNGSALQIVLSDLLNFTPEEVQETSTMKIALNVLVNFVRYFGSGLCTDPNDAYAGSIQKVEGLNEFFISKIVSLAFEIPFKPEYKFNIKEGTYRVVACDLSRLLKEIYIQSGAGSDPNTNPALKYLSEIYLPQIQFPNQLTMELLEALVTADQKQFEKYYVALIDRLMS
ncbi:hypothetical protein KAFR_0E00290 [Kazachstania africana CBS 2517]|uniref:Exportin-T n=1 Tax=Kazachstania africana (strain ATCC 22294 / BCRC 22015 / CBS 2517 / CECT 1963 / NBRC 1671 / NRRL Y-8276) TaxID=1071382 RepID=H2AUY3_KAZAF|nr:hypothetical protein KAFR_0E00290 [Kazachstania africana CBS 2517]CCF58183.1 hypothetical protein KAFR_0E00290 [Kazachstania africana CBS 2517]